MIYIDKDSSKPTRKAVEKHIAPLSPMEIEEKEILHKRLQWEKDTILEVRIS